MTGIEDERDLPNLRRVGQPWADRVHFALEPIQNGRHARRPEKPLFDKTWKLPDIERIAAQ
jgi:hypothetical protein